MNKDLKNKRLSENQEAVLITLFLMSQNGQLSVKIPPLLKFINKKRIKKIHRNSFRLTIGQLIDKGGVAKQLLKNLTWVISATDKGLEAGLLAFNEKGEREALEKQKRLAKPGRTRA